MPLPHAVLTDRLIRYAHREAQKMGHRTVEVPHLLLALSLGGNSYEARALLDGGLYDRTIRETLRKQEGFGFRSMMPSRPSSRTTRVIEASATWAARMDSPTVRPFHLLTAALMSEPGREFVGGPEGVRIIRESYWYQQAGAHARSVSQR